MKQVPVEWPDGKRFAFTIFDDTDASTVKNSAPVYRLLRDLGFRTTKSVWTLGSDLPPVVVGGDTCSNPGYREWVLQLQSEGFEIGFHNSCFNDSKRERTIKGLSQFEKLFGHQPKSMANHTDCRENLYWGSDRLTGLAKLVYQTANLGRKTKVFEGHIEGSDYFWGDLCEKQISYVRNFVYPDINTLKACPWMPYHDPKRRFVNNWFASSDGGDLTSFVRTLGKENQERLEDEGGACIMYAHLGKFFREDGVVTKEFSDLMELLASREGWFVPVTRLLDHIHSVRGAWVISDSERRALEIRWLLYRLRNGTI